MVLLKGAALLAVFASASSVIASVAALSERTPGPGQFCRRFDHICASSCGDARHGSKSAKTTCANTGKDRFRFACTCGDGTNLLAEALQRVTGYDAEVIKYKGKATSTKVRKVTKTSLVVSIPVQTTTALATISSFTATSGTSTIYVYWPSSYVGGDIPYRQAYRRATPTSFCEQFSITCKRLCTEFYESTVNTNICALVSAAKSKYQEYHLSCKSNRYDYQLNSAILDGFNGTTGSGFNYSVPTDTITRTIRSTIIKTIVKTESRSRTYTLPTSTRTKRVGTTTVKTIKAAVETVKVPLHGRIRVDLLRPGKNNATVGYIAVSKNPDGGDEAGNIRPTAKSEKAAPVTMVLEDTTKQNVWGIRWTTSGVDYFVTQVVNGEYYEYELGNPCGRSFFQWDPKTYPFTAPDDDFYYYAPDPRETWTWTLGRAEPNIVSPERKLQIPLRPLWLQSNGQIDRPFAVYDDDKNAYSPLLLSDARASSKDCNLPGKSVDVTYYFEPNVIPT